MKKKITMLFLLTLGTISYTQAQNGNGVGIGEPLPDASAMLDVSGQYNKGVLLPRVELIDLTTFKLEGNSMTEGLIVYNTNATLGAGFYFWVKEKPAAGTEPLVLAHWEKITDQTTVEMLDKRITKIEVDITNITGGSSAKLSYLIRFRPKVDANGEDEMFYLKPEGNNPETYKEVRIDKNIVTSFESKTDIGRQVFDGTNWGSVVTSVAVPATAEKDEIIYNYKSEVDPATQQPVHYYMNLTKDIIEAVTNSTILKREITNVIKNEGGNVYYGVMEGVVEKVFYEWIVDPTDATKKIKKEISIKDIVINNFSTIITNPSVETVLETIIKEKTKVVITDTGGPTGEIVDGKLVYKVMLPSAIVMPSTGQNFNSKMEGAFTLPHYEGGRVLDVQIFDAQKKLIMSTVTNLTIDAVSYKVDFNFGVGNMFSTLPLGTGHTVVFTYVSNDDGKPTTP